jgi:hypothetical protein
VIPEIPLRKLIDFYLIVDPKLVLPYLHLSPDRLKSMSRDLNLACSMIQFIGSIVSYVLGSWETRVYALQLADR